MTLEKNLRELRAIYGLSQDDVAKAIDVSRSSVVATEKGQRELSSEELGKLADFLGVDIIDLLSQEIPDYEKYREMIVETLRRYTKYAGKSATKTLLAKLIYLADFAWYYEHLQPMSGMKYRRLQYGPVPDQYFRVVDELIDEGKVSLEVGDEAQWLNLTRSAQDTPPQHLSTGELDLIDKIAKKWKGSNTKEIVHFTHTQLPWQICRQNEYIPYELITQEEPSRVY